MPVCLFSLPYSSLNDLLSCWLDLSALSTPDCACCGTIVRTRYSIAVFSAAIMISQSKCRAVDSFVQFLRWIRKRRFILRSFTVPNRILELAEFFSECTPWNARADKLKYLSLEDCIDLTNQSFIDLIRGCTAVVTIRLGCSSLRSWITDVSLITLSSTCQFLEVFKIENNNCITDAGMQAVVDHCQRLRSISILACGLITDDTLNCIAKRSHHLRELSISCNMHITCTGLEMVLRSCQDLERLSLLRCRASLPVGADLCCPALKVVLYSRHQTCAEPNISEFLRSGPAVTVLKLVNMRRLCDGMNDPRMYAEKLEELSLVDCSCVPPGQLQAMLSRCSNLQCLSLHHSQATDTVVDSIARFCARLVTADLSWSVRVSDTALYNLRTLPLQQLVVKGCTNITTDGVRKLVEEVNTLECVDVSYCPRVQAADLQQAIPRDGLCWVYKPFGTIA